MVAPFAGGCLCGAVRYESAAEPVAFMLCHCRDCQYISGGEPAAVAVVPKAAFRVCQGEPELRTYAVAGESGKKVTRAFCGTCGTPLFSDLEGMPHLWAIKAGSMDDPSWLKPTAFIWTRSAQPWAHLDPALPKFEKQPG
ncbi:MAG TPA: GFA family protein [Rhizomicrobium sp.]|nr:GFA family protein [Rhizomicrobium sp.]